MVRLLCVLWLVLAAVAAAQTTVSPQSGAPIGDSRQSSKVQEVSIAPTALLKKCVGFLTIWIEGPTGIRELRGTGFFVFYPDQRLGQNGGFVYLVTNRHMVDPTAIGLHGTIVSSTLRLNLNKEENGLQSAESNLPPAAKWYFPVDSSIDLAVAPVLPNQAIIDFQPIPLSLFATKEVVRSRQITEGDPVLFTGFFYQFPGVKRIEPIVREGILAMMPAEKLPTTLGAPGDLYLADVHVFGGNSGSPLFVNVGGFHGGNMIIGGFPYMLLGVVSGYVYETEDLQLRSATTFIGKATANSGIATIVPVDQLKTLLESGPLQAQRDADLNRIRTDNSSKK